MKLIAGERYQINSNSKCHSFCESVCSSCKINSIGEYTGNHWIEEDGSPLYEFLYYRSGRRVIGIFTEEHVVFKLK